MKHIEIFKPGKHKATSGAVIEFTESQMLAAAAAYNPSVHEAPLVVGHPKDNGPAYGWVKSLQFSDGIVQALPDQVDAAFAEMVNAGRFKKVSASWYTPDSPHNPVPGTYYLRHVGFLGAQPPAVKGLKSASFAEAEQGVIEFADWADLDNADLWRRVREWLIAKFGTADADQVVPAYLVDGLKADAMTEDPAPSASGINYQEGATMLTPEQLAAKEAALQERETALAAREQEARNQEINEFAEGLIQAGQLLPANKAQVVGLMQSMPEATFVSFGEGDSKVEKPALQVLKEFLSAQPKVVAFGEAAGTGKDAGEELNDNKAVSDRATAYKRRMDAQGQSISFAEAVDAVHKGLDK